MGTAGGSEVYSPDYHLTRETPLWAATHLHAITGPWALSIHSGLEVGVVLSGREEVDIGDTSLDGHPGDVWLCSMSELHRYRVAVPGTRNLVLVFLPSLLGEEMLGDIPWIALFAAQASRRPRTTPETRAKLLLIASELAEEVTEKREGWQAIVRLDLLRLLFHLSRDWDHGRANETAVMSNLARIMPAIQLVHDRTPGKVTRQEAAHACGLGPSRFTMLFGETMGVSFTSFRRRTQLAFAANLLVTTDLTADQVAESTGFSDASHLHHAFVRDYGCTPGQYRKQAAGSPPPGVQQELPAHLGYDGGRSGS